MASTHPIPPTLGKHQREQEPVASSSFGCPPSKEPEEFDHVTFDNFDHASADATVLDELENSYGWTYDDDPSLHQLGAILAEIVLPYILPPGPFDPKYSQKIETRQLLASNEALRRKVKECWKKGKFEEIRSLVILRPPQAPPPPKRRVASSLRVLWESLSEDEVIGS